MQAVYYVKKINLLLTIFAFLAIKLVLHHNMQKPLLALAKIVLRSLAQNVLNVILKTAPNALLVIILIQTKSVKLALWAIIVTMDMKNINVNLEHIKIKEDKHLAKPLLTVMFKMVLEKLVTLNAPKGHMQMVLKPLVSHVLPVLIAPMVKSFFVLLAQRVTLAKAHVRVALG